MAVKQGRVSDLSGRQATEEQFAKLIVHQHPQYQGPIILDVLPEELGELPDSEQYVSIEVLQPGERSGQRALLSVERFNQLASRGDMRSILMNAVAAQQPQPPASPAGGVARPEIARAAPGRSCPTRAWRWFRSWPSTAPGSPGARWSCRVCRWWRPGACQACSAASRRCWVPSGSPGWPDQARIRFHAAG